MEEAVATGVSWVQYIPQIISALGVIIAAWFSYNQYTKNKQTDQKIEQWKKEETAKSAKKSEDIAKIYGELWQLLHDLGSDRVYIIQPHPLTANLFLSIRLEVKRNGVSSMRSVINKLPMSELAEFSAELATRDFLYYRNVDEDVKDKRARAMFATNGCHMAVIKRLSDQEHDWVGSLTCEYARPTDISPITFKQAMIDAANHIQYILPEIR
jgi:hypothetical protein